ncbi:hypothetical protein BD289DRAFT_445539 [Coniella lustricola]|uniref:Uncharacterized protein n=1 Tax=Coniella lustricola TaxID=2025994 RepID=A0A2T2ZUT7_9PEZI|nr:hypothetical protein BD289DRAFT_445539 [Coniella lustricola]
MSASLSLAALNPSARELSSAILATPFMVRATVCVFFLLLWKFRRCVSIHTYDYPERWPRATTRNNNDQVASLHYG